MYLDLVDMFDGLTVVNNVPSGVFSLIPEDCYNYEHDFLFGKTKQKMCGGSCTVFIAYQCSAVYKNMICRFCYCCVYVYRLKI